MPAKDVELGRELLTLPTPTAAEQAPAAKRGQLPTDRQVETRLRRGLEGVRDASEAGSTSRAAALSLLPDGADALLASIAAAVVTRWTSRSGQPSPQADDQWLPPLLYEEAVTAVAEGDVARATTALAVSLHWKAGEADALLGLAVCAVRLERFDQAQSLAFERLRLGQDHPRALCIVGLCELKRGDRRTAQSYLAAAARLARRNPAFREELRASQRLLILMHFD
jgi:tetratricopeptide (TPR) repeat protein